MFKKLLNGFSFLQKKQAVKPWGRVERDSVVEASFPVHKPATVQRLKNYDPVPLVESETYNTEFITKEVIRLAKAAAGNWCPNGGWQFPYDFGNGILVSTYTEVQLMHTWRRDVMLDAVEQIFPGPREHLSVLDLGAGEGAMAIGLWGLGFRDITCVEVRPLNVEKSKLAASVFGAKLKFVNMELEDFLAKEEKKYDLVLFMGILYHLLNPCSSLEKVSRVAKSILILETVVALPELMGFKNKGSYSPQRAGFYLRHDSKESNTAGLSDLEFWPDREGLRILLTMYGFSYIEELAGFEPRPDYYQDHSRIMLVGLKHNGICED